MGNNVFNLEIDIFKEEVEALVLFCCGKELTEIDMGSINHIRERFQDFLSITTIKESEYEILIEKSRILVNRIAEYCNEKGLRILYIDTDSINFQFTDGTTKMLQFEKFFPFFDNLTEMKIKNAKLKRNIL